MHRLQSLFPTSTLEHYLLVCEELLLAEASRVRFEQSRVWARQFPEGPGVYAVFELGTLAYVGESGQLRGRMSDLYDTRNHTLRRSLGKKWLSDQAGFVEATSSRKFPLHIEDQLAAQMASALSVTTIVVPFGRREIEEWIVEAHRPAFNTKLRRA